MNRSIAAATLAALLLVPCGDARALAQRTFVSAAVGADANVAVNCAIANPCRSFGAAMTVTLADGEIIVLDSGGYGRVTIDKSVSIVAPPGIYAGISVFAVQDGVNIFTPGITVVLRGLTINGQGGDRGISVIAANVVLHVERCVISNLKFMGILVSTVGPSVELFVKDTIVRGNGSGIILSGAHATLNRVIVEKNAGLAMQVRDGNVALNESVIARNGSQGLVIDRISAGSSVATISDTVVTENANEGVWVGPDPGSLSVTINRATIGGNGGAGVNIAVSDVSASRVELVGSTIKSNGSDGVRIQRFTGAAASVLTATDNIISGNAGRGILAFGNDIYAIVNRNTITMNTGVGIEQSTSAVVESRGDNVVRGNNFGAAQTAGVITGIPGI